MIVDWNIKSAYITNHRQINLPLDYMFELKIMVVDNEILKGRARCKCLKGKIKRYLISYLLLGATEKLAAGGKVISHKTAMLYNTVSIS